MKDEQPRSELERELQELRRALADLQAAKARAQAAGVSLNQFEPYLRKQIDDLEIKLGIQRT